MKKLLEYIWLECKVEFRVPIAIFFTLFFPILLLAVLVISTENKVISGQIHFVDIYLPIMMLLSLMSSGIISFSVIVAGNRGRKIWQMYRLRGFKLYQIILSQLFVNILISFMSQILLLIFAKVIFNARIPKTMDLLFFLMIWFIIAVSIFLIGFVLGVCCKNEKNAQAISTPFLFILMILSGSMLEENRLPKDLQSFVSYLPTNQANRIFVSAWNATTNREISWIVIIVWVILSLSFVIWKLYRDDFRRI